MFLCRIHDNDHIWYYLDDYLHKKFRQLMGIICLKKSSHFHVFLCFAQWLYCLPQLCLCVDYCLWKASKSSTLFVSLAILSNRSITTELSVIGSEVVKKNTLIMAEIGVFPKYNKTLILILLTDGCRRSC